MLEGKSTYISAVLVVISGLLFWAGLIDQATFTGLISIFMGTGLAGMRRAIKNEK